MYVVVVNKIVLFTMYILLLFSSNRENKLDARMFEKE